jgi:hypothetical protein
MRVKTVLAWREDIGQKCIRIPKLVRDAIGVDLGDKVLATGPKGSLLLTAVIADPSEIGRKVAGIDGVDRRALGVELGQKITVSEPQRRATRRTRATTYLLFSYGSNNPEQLDERLGYHPTQVAAAYLPGYRLKFMGYSFRRKGGVAGLVKKRGAEACGYVAQVTADDLDIMDDFEGVAGGYYYRKKLPVVVDIDGEFIKQDAIVYLPGPQRLNAPEHHFPSEEYLEAVEKTIFGFWDADGECRNYLDAALEEVIGRGLRRNPYRRNAKKKKKEAKRRQRGKARQKEARLKTAEINKKYARRRKKQTRFNRYTDKLLADLTTHSKSEVSKYLAQAFYEGKHEDDFRLSANAADGSNYAVFKYIVINQILAPHFGAKMIANFTPTELEIVSRDITKYGYKLSWEDAEHTSADLLLTRITGIYRLAGRLPSEWTTPMIKGVPGSTPMSIVGKLLNTPVDDLDL